jgi:hypothetical protein
MAKSTCTTCGQEFTVPDDVIASSTVCHACQQSGKQGATPSPAEEVKQSKICGICLSALEAGEESATCSTCGASYHADCWLENKGCAVYGCSGAPHVDQRSSVEIPVSFWGQESKPCPSCGREILAAATRCRFCGATFASAQPEDTHAFKQRTEREKRLPQIRQTVVWIFVLSVIPCSAPIGGLWGLIWFPTHRSDVDTLPALYPALCKIGIGVGLGQTVLMILVSIIYAVTRGS